ncbi:hypothetical protein [Oceanicola sp. S124]|uniref:hypothetical protein n=1 Tax=Oceanicola sp. S124 TaxID=1042378 RepID=UPI00025582AC|nr:hypothetical protein [Oceanicola sp. S124]
MTRNLADGFFLAAACFYVSALMHLAVAVLGEGPLTALLIAALFWAALATALLRRIRVLGWLAFLAGLGGGLVALGYGIPVLGLGAMIHLVIALACWLGALCLGVHLWRYRGPFQRA